MVPPISFGSKLDGHCYIGANPLVDGVLGAQNTSKKKVQPMKCDIHLVLYNPCVGDEVEMVDVAELVEFSLMGRARGRKFVLDTINE